MILGFIGAGGAGILLAVLTTFFHVPIHQAVGTAIGAMCFITISGAISHFREGNVVWRFGLVVGGAGVLAAAIGARLSEGLPEDWLRIGAALSLWFLALLVWIRTRYADRWVPRTGDAADIRPTSREVAIATGLGVTGGISAGFFGVGMAPFLQLGYLTALKLPLRMAIGTTMLTLVFISGSAATVLAQHGAISFPHLSGAVIGMSTGAWFGAKFTRNAPPILLRVAVVGVPVLAGSLLLFA